ncbi:homeobox protein not2-like [Alosa sapidissima]|uniref:homeobox protein not2-like n=1 Tax=Alosa sapidissima TaxID=34773 RepID=UPI001C0850CA|nr:homeobox protein not2-like [Alosa sapidissima]
MTWTLPEKLGGRREGHLPLLEGSLQTKSSGPWAQPKYSFSIDAILSTDHRCAHPQQIIASHVPLSSPYAYISARAPYQQQLLQPHLQPFHHHSYETDIYDGNTVYPNHLTCRGCFVRKTCRRIRTIFTTEQLTRLEEVFSKQRYMTGTEKMLLASALRLTEIQVKVWFQNRRTKWRKSKEDQAQHSPCSVEEEFISVDSDDSL